MLWEFKKFQEICNQISTRIFKIDGEKPEIIFGNVGNPQNSGSKKTKKDTIWAIPEILLFLRLRFFNFNMPQKYQNKKMPILNGKKPFNFNMPQKYQNKKLPILNEKKA